MSALVYFTFVPSRSVHPVFVCLEFSELPQKNDPDDKGVPHYKKEHKKVEED